MATLRSVRIWSCIHRPTTSVSTGRTVRPISSATVTDSDIAELAAKPLHPLTLEDLVKHGRPPLTPHQLYSSANFSLSILPKRLAHRIQSLRNLPFIVVSNPHVTKIHNYYLHSLSTLLPYAQRSINSMEEAARFAEVMSDLVQTHSNTIPILARGFLESRKYISPEAVTRFLDEHLRARIGTRLVAEQHIALHFASLTDEGHAKESSIEEESNHSSYIGVIDTQLRPAAIVRHCESFVSEICELRYGVRPSVVINGDVDYTFAHIPVHLEYIITELLKNAFRATIEHGHERDPVEITLAPAPEEPAPATKGITHADQGNLPEQPDPTTKNQSSTVSGNISPLDKSTPGVTIRIRDRGGGIPPDNLAHLWTYGFTTFSEDRISDLASGGAGNGNMDALNVISGAGGEDSSIAGLGYGLPLGRAYAEYFGGGIGVQSLWGWGTDVYLSLRGVGKIS